MPASVKRILVPVDFSECSGSALKQACALAEALQAEVEVLHAYEVPPYLPPHIRLMTGEAETPLSDYLERSANERLSEFLTEHGIPDVARSVHSGPAAPVILERLERGGIDLVVMGTHGRRGVARLLMGSTAQEVLRSARCPVLTVRDEGASE